MAVTITLGDWIGQQDWNIRPYGWSRDRAEPALREPVPGGLTSYTSPRVEHRRSGDAWPENRPHGTRQDKRRWWSAAGSGTTLGNWLAGDTR